MADRIMVYRYKIKTFQAKLSQHTHTRVMIFSKHDTKAHRPMTDWSPHVSTTNYKQLPWLTEPSNERRMSDIMVKYILHHKDTCTTCKTQTISSAFIQQLFCVRMHHHRLITSWRAQTRQPAPLLCDPQRTSRHFPSFMCGFYGTCINASGRCGLTSWMVQTIACL